MKPPFKLVFLSIIFFRLLPFGITATNHHPDHSFVSFIDLTDALLDTNLPI